MVEIDRKRELIIDGAIKRFTHFGVNKTTMNEIADDLSVSKPSLYYYFPDKSSLVLGVIDRIFSDYFAALEKDYNSEFPFSKTIMNIIEIRHRFFQKYYMLHLSGGAPDSSLNSVQIKTFVTLMRDKDLNLHSSIFQHAVDKEEIYVDDVDRITELFMDSLNGITSLCIAHGNKELFPSKKELKIILDKQLGLAAIFIKGLRK
jgi:AcrR family transcriptional regulator